jgi:tetratricopeptide (TPR) repeat protein
MKQFLLVTALLAASVALAQSTPGGSPQAPPQTQSGTAAQPPAAAGGKTMPQAKTQEEFKAYQDAAAKTNPAETEAAADAFAAKYPDSELRALLYRKTMYDYQNANNADKTSAMAKKVIAIDPNNPEALVTLATATAQTTRDTDLDRDERLNEASGAANKALQTIDTDLLLPANAPLERVTAYKNSMRAMAYDALGTVALVKKDYPGAETNFRKSADLNSQPDPVTWLRLSVALDQQKKYPEALEAANKAVQFSADSPQANNLAKMERDRLQKLVNSPPAAGTPPPNSPSPNAPSTQPVPTSPTTSTPPASKPPGN